MRAEVVDRYAREVGGVRVVLEPGQVIDMPDAEILAEKSRRYPRVIPFVPKTTEQLNQEEDDAIASRELETGALLQRAAEEFSELPLEMRELQTSRTLHTMGWQLRDARGEVRGEPPEMSLPEAFEKLTGIQTPEGAF
jgi:hypothetical protein